MIRALRRWFKSLACRRFSVIEFCHGCGVRQPLVWTAADPLWFEVADSGESGVLCPTCFDRRASAKGIALRWIPTVDYRFGTVADGTIPGGKNA